MSTPNTKYLNTALKLNMAMLSLLEEKSLEFITVKEICERAGVNRSTFYLHYETIHDLLSECVENSTKKFSSYYPEYLDRDSITALIERIPDAPLEDLVFISQKYLIPYLTFIKEYAVLYKAAYHNPSVLGSEDRLERLYFYFFDPILSRFSVPEEAKRFVISFYVHGITSVVLDWLEGGCKEPVEKIAEIIMMCVLSKEKTEKLAKVPEENETQ